MHIILAISRSCDKLSKALERSVKSIPACNPLSRACLILSSINNKQC